MRVAYIIIGLVSVIYLNIVDSKEVTPASKQITVTLDSDIKLKWSISSDITITAINVYFNTTPVANKIISGTGDGVFVSNAGKKRFGDRISAEIMNDNKVGVKIQKAKLNETNSVFIINVLEVKDGKVTEFVSEIKLIVQGGPIFCADQIPATRTYHENATPSISVTVCGIPKPTVTLKLGSSSLPVGESKNSTSQSHGYDYSVTLPNLKPSMCGKQVLLQADGNSGKITASSTLDIEFTPAFITSVQFYKADACNQVTWLPLDTGNCDIYCTVYK